MNTKKFTILHSNDMHGDFLAEMRAGETKLIGGLALLSGYINKVRNEEENVLYVIAGDMLQGSLIDSEYKGVSTMGLMNYLAPDVVSLGNHEFDYGLSHLLFLEKVANFPIVNSNLYIKPYNLDYTQIFSWNCSALIKPEAIFFLSFVSCQKFLCYFDILSNEFIRKNFNSFQFIISYFPVVS